MSGAEGRSSIFDGWMLGGVFQKVPVQALRSSKRLGTSYRREIL